MSQTLPLENWISLCACKYDFNIVQCNAVMSDMFAIRNWKYKYYCQGEWAYQI